MALFSLFLLRNDGPNVWVVFFLCFTCAFQSVLIVPKINLFCRSLLMRGKVSDYHLKFLYCIWLLTSQFTSSFEGNSLYLPQISQILLTLHSKKNLKGQKPTLWFFYFWKVVASVRWRLNHNGKKAFSKNTFRLIDYLQKIFFH